MEPATLAYRTLDGQTDAVLTSPEFAARLMSVSRPRIDVGFDGDLMRFTADTAEIMLKARVEALFEDTFGDGWRKQVALARK